MASDATQVVDIYQNRQSGQFRIQPYARAGSSSQPFGDFVIVEADVSDQDLLHIVLDALKKSDMQKYDFSRAPVWTKAEYTRMLKEEKLIGVRLALDSVRLVPCVRMRNSFGSVDEKVVTLSREVFFFRGGEVIRELFRELS